MSAMAQVIAQPQAPYLSSSEKQQQFCLVSSAQPVVYQVLSSSSSPSWSPVAQPMGLQALATPQQSVQPALLQVSQSLATPQQSVQPALLQVSQSLAAAVPTTLPLAHPHMCQLLPSNAHPQQQQRVQLTTIFFAGVTPVADTQRLRVLFSQFGRVMDLNLFRPYNGCRTSKGCGLVSFSQHSEAAAALETLSGRFVWPGARSPMVIEWCDPSKQHKKKRAQPLAHTLMAQHSAHVPPTMQYVQLPLQQQQPAPLQHQQQQQPMFLQQQQQQQQQQLSQPHQPQQVFLQAAGPVPMVGHEFVQVYVNQHAV